jgi:hypothetical protein
LWGCSLKSMKCPCSCAMLTGLCAASTRATNSSADLSYKWTLELKWLF